MEISCNDSHIQDLHTTVLGLMTEAVMPFVPPTWPTRNTDINVNDFATNKFDKTSEVSLTTLYISDGLEPNVASIYACMESMMAAARAYIS
jgi:hypothetical protein